MTANAWENSSIIVKTVQEQVEEKLTVAQNRKKNSNVVSKKTVVEILHSIEERTKDGSFRAYLQPKADVQSGKVCGAEALIRLNDPEKGIISPVSFLPAIERAGLIRYIDLFMLECVCRLIAKWTAAGWDPFTISLNYSRSTILEPGYSGRNQPDRRKIRSCERTSGN